MKNIGKTRRRGNLWVYLLMLGVLFAAVFLYANSPHISPDSNTPRPDFKHTAIELRTAAGTSHRFDVEVARNQSEQSYGLMYVKDMPDDAGMLFLFPEPNRLTFWMKNTYIPLDILFLDSEGRIINIAENTQPLSTDMITSASPGKGVLELKGGTAAKLGLRPGDRVIHPSLSP
ncbi:MAG: DUF192 domain-containing protein [Alphaproteobacteria bacterium]|nr:DUF192 domain-containing protein [Alphaproteobacteria bacterium]